MSGSTRYIMTPEDSPETNYGPACRIIEKMVRNYFAQPGVREEFEAWLMSEEGMAVSERLRQEDERLALEEMQEATI